MVEGNGDGNKLHVSFSKNDEINTLLGNQGTNLGLKWHPILKTWSHGKPWLYNYKVNIKI